MYVRFTNSVLDMLKPAARVLIMIGFVAAVAAGAANAQTNAQSRKSFASAEDAARSLVEAVKANDQASVEELFGASAMAWILSGDPVADEQGGKRFVAAYEQKHDFERTGDDKAVLLIGNDAFPFPFPIVRVDGKWSFDPDQGKEELLRRRIGRNELNTMQVLLAIVDAQREYAAEARDSSKILAYAPRFASSQGRRNGLYWPSKEGEPQSPLGELVARAASEGYERVPGGVRTPYHGYFFRMLVEQGKDAPGGAYSYLVNGRLIGGFAVLAYPASYAASGVMSFLVGSDGVVYQKDLGPNTGVLARYIRAYNPDQTWKRQ